MAPTGCSAAAFCASMRRQTGAPAPPFSFPESAFFGEAGLAQTRHAHPSVVSRPDAMALAADATRDSARAFASSPVGR